MGISKDFKALFSKTHLSTRESDEILLDLKSELGNHNNISLIMEELSSYTYKGKMQRVMRHIFERVNAGEALEEVFLVHGVIDNEELILLKRATSTLNGLTSILSFREEGNQFFVFLRKVFMPFYLFFLAGIASFTFTTPLLKNFLNTEVAPLVKEKRNFEVEFAFPAFMENESYLYIFLFTLLSVTAIIIFFYINTRNTRIDKLYKVSHLSFYDDFIKYFTIASMMKKGGATSDQVFEDLSFQATQGLQSTFRDMYVKGSDYYESLLHLNAPYRIASQLRRNEENSKFWENLDTTINYVKSLRKDKVDFYVKYFSSTFFLLGMLFFIFCLSIPVVYMILNIYTFAM